MRFFNKAAHYLIGFWCGWNARNPASAVGAGVFVAYQALEQNAIRDGAYGEMREFAVGYGVGLSARWLREKVKTIPASGK